MLRNMDIEPNSISNLAHEVKLIQDDIKTQQSIPSTDNNITIGEIFLFNLKKKKKKFEPKTDHRFSQSIHMQTIKT